MRKETEVASEAGRAPDDPFRHLAEHAPVVLWTSDAEGRPTYVNRAWCLFTGQPAGAPGDFGWDGVVHPEDVNRVSGEFRQAHLTRQPLRVEYRLRRHDGVYRDVMDAAQPRFSDSGAFLGLVGSLTDITDLKTAERAVRAGETRFRRLFDSDLIGLLTADFEGQVLEANDTFLRMMGYTREDLSAGRINWGAMTPDAWREVSARAVHELKTLGVARPFEKEYFHRDGTPIPVLVGSTRLASEGLNFTFVLDLSDRKRSDQRLQLLSEASHLLAQSIEVPAVDLEQVARLATQSVATFCLIDVPGDGPDSDRRVTVVHRDPVIERRIREAVKIPKLVAPNPLLQLLESGQPVLVEDLQDETLARAAVGPLHLSVLRTLQATSLMAVPIRAGGRVLGVLALATSKPLRRFSAADLPLGGELGLRVGAAVENARLYLEAKAAVGLRDEFLAVASHELKTPLTPLKLKLDSLRLEAAGTLPHHVPRPRLLRGLEVADSQLRKLTGLIDSLLDVARLAQGRMTLDLEEGVCMAAIGRDVVTGLLLQAEKAGTALELRAPPSLPARVDRARLEQVFQNLISNALKYGAGAPVQVTLEAVGSRAVFTVKDSGIGIAPEALPRLFGKFQRAVSERHYGGLGLGLYITRQIVQAMGGTVGAQSVLGQGSVFTVELPLDGPR